MPLGEIVKTFVSTMLTGASIGAVAAFMVYYFLTRKLIPKYLQNIVLLAIVIAAFAFSNVLHHESGLLAVTVMGMILTNLKMPDLKDIIKFNEEVVIILISFLFVMLSSRIDLVDIELLANINALWLFLVVVLVLRPISVFASTIKSNLSLQEKLFISWISPRGIVTAAIASIFSIQLAKNPNPVLEMDETFMLLPLTFLIIVGTVVLQGLTAKPLARILGVVRQAPNGVIFLSADEPARYLANILKANNIPTLLADTSRANTSSAHKAGFYTYQGSLLGEEVWEKLDFSQFGQLFAMTPNIEINQLTCRTLAQEFGSERVFRLIDGKEAKAEKLENYEHHILLGGQADFINLAHTIRKNPEPQMLTLESAEQLPQFLEEQKKEILPLFVIHKGTRVSPITHASIESSAGDVFYYLKK
jgi:NhaP-type Na+/H+ or K+/H+ antiporter